MTTKTISRDEYVRLVALAYLAAPAESEDEMYLSKALDEACGRYDLEPDTVVEALVRAEGPFLGPDDV